MEGGGTLSLEEEGLRVHLRAVCPDDGRGLWVRGRGGSLLLGTLTPENGRLALSRTLSRSTLGQAGCWPVTGGNTVLVFPFTEQSEEGEPWRPEPDPARLCRDPLLRLLQRAGGGGAPVGSPLFRSKGISAAGAVLSGPGGGTGGAALAGVAL